MSVDEEDMCVHNDRKGKCKIMSSSKHFPEVSPGKDTHTECDGMMEGCGEYDSAN